MTETPNYLDTKLPNGLMIHLKEIHTAPIISSWLWYRVGSRNEQPGITGVSHWVEHMQFKGTDQFPPGILDKIISREGGVWNAMTYIDWTTFFETMPADKIDIAFQLEADRMVNSKYDPKEVASERTVIISEREGNENEPLFKLGEAIQKKAFKAHPYHHEVIGDMKDLRSMTRDDLYRHYRQYYHPGNAILAVAGDFAIPEMLEKLTGYFGGIPCRKTPELTMPMEMLQKEERRVEVKGPGETSFIQVAYHSPNARHPDFFPLVVLDSLLTGPSSLNMFGGGGISNKTSRLYQALVEKEFTVGVHGGLQATVDPFLYDITLTVHPERTPDEVMAAFDEQIGKVLDQAVSAAEIQRAIKQARALFVYSSENITNQAFWMGYSEIFANYDWFQNYMARLAEVTREDILRVAQIYLKPANRVVGYYIPSKKKARGNS
jgi:zinc protease